MDLTEIKRVVELSSPQAARRVNEYLDLGWVLLQTSSMTTDHHEYSEAQIKYSLGWPHDEEPQEPQIGY